jgi:hypothetical protein
VEVVEDEGHRGFSAGSLDDRRKLVDDRDPAIGGARCRTCERDFESSSYRIITESFDEHTVGARLIALVC